MSCTIITNVVVMYLPSSTGHISRRSSRVFNLSICQCSILPQPPDPTLPLMWVVNRQAEAVRTINTPHINELPYSPRHANLCLDDGNQTTQVAQSTPYKSVASQTPARPALRPNGRHPRRSPATTTMDNPGRSVRRLRSLQRRLRKAVGHTLSDATRPPRMCLT